MPEGKAYLDEAEATLHLFPCQEFLRLWAQQHNEQNPTKPRATGKTPRPAERSGLQAPSEPEAACPFAVRKQLERLPAVVPHHYSTTNRSYF